MEACFSHKIIYYKIFFILIFFWNFQVYFSQLFYLVKFTRNLWVNKKFLYTRCSFSVPLPLNVNRALDVELRKSIYKEWNLHPHFRTSPSATGLKKWEQKWLILCFTLFSQTRDANYSGQRELAERKSKTALTLNHIGLGIGLGIGLCIIVVIIIIQIVVWTAR